MNTEVSTYRDPGEIAESLIIQGDLSRLQPAERAEYFTALCKSLGLNPLTKPFDYINLSGKLTLYAKKDATDQLRRIYKVSITRIEQTNLEGVHIVTAYAAMPDGRTDSDSGAVNISGLKGDALANAVMKAITKAKRRVTLSICGLGVLDETELDTIPGAAPYVERAPAQLSAPPFPSRWRDFEAFYTEAHQTFGWNKRQVQGRLKQYGYERLHAELLEEQWEKLAQEYEIEQVPDDAIA
jgi:hypothetical protein